MRIELEDQGIKIHGHTLGVFNGWAEIDEDTGSVDRLVIYEDIGVGPDAKRIEVDMHKATDPIGAQLRHLLVWSIMQSDRVIDIVHERQMSLVRDRMAAMRGDRSYNAEL